MQVKLFSELPLRSRVYVFPFVPLYAASVYGVLDTTLFRPAFYTDYNRLFNALFLSLVLLIQTVLILSTFWSIDYLYPKLCLSEIARVEDAKIALINASKRRRRRAEMGEDYRRDVEERESSAPKRIIAIVTPAGNDAASSARAPSVTIRKAGCTELYLLPDVSRDVVRFDYEKICFELDERTMRFEPMRYPIESERDFSQFTKEISSSSLTSQPTSHPLDISQTQRDRILRRYGENRIEIPLPEIPDLMLEQALSPFFIFQFFCVTLWLLDEYWYFALFTMVMLVVFEWITAQNRRKNAQTARDMLRPSRLVRVLKDGAWTTLDSRHLVPGDLVLIGGVTEEREAERGGEEGVYCVFDAVLLTGSCVVNEAMLTGESTPKMKISYDEDVAGGESSSSSSHDRIYPLESSRCVVLAGTTILRSTASSSPPTSNGTSSRALLAGVPVQEAEREGAAIGLVVRTGFGTVQGGLMRTIIYASERVTADTKEAYAFMFVLVVVALVGASYVVWEGLKDPRRSKWKLALHSVMIVTSVVPPELPMELSLAVTTSLSKLMQRNVYCTEPYRIPLAGALGVCAFDKTGTLTSDDLTALGVSRVNPAPLASRLDDISGKGEEIETLLAVCNELVTLGAGRKVSGSPTETAAWRFAGGGKRWKIVSGGEFVRSLTTGPPGVRRASSAKSSSSSGALKRVKVLRRFPFSSAARRMSVVVAEETVDASGGGGKSMMVYAKGAPEVMAHIISPCPSDFTKVAEELACQGYRVLALAGKRLGGREGSAKLPTREEAERGLEFYGLLALDSPLKIGTLETVQALRDSGHRVVMITGDNPLTALNVARRAGIGRGRGEGGVETEVVTGVELEAMEESEARETVRRVDVFARVSPRQKERVLDLLREAQDEATLMCGDGTNDVGALKRADVGVSIVSHPELERIGRAVVASSSSSSSLGLEGMLELTGENEGATTTTPLMVRLGDASVASPFTAKTPSIEAIVDIVRQGRCTLVTTVQMFKILAANGLLHSFSMTALYLRGVKQGDTQSTIAGLLVAFIFALLSFTQPVTELAARRPVRRIFHPAVVGSVLGQSLVHLFTLVRSVQLVDTHLPTSLQTIEPDAEFSPNLLNTVVFATGLGLQANIFAVNYRGRPFMASLRENKPLARLLLATYLAGFLAAGSAMIGVPSSLLAMVELVPVPIEVGAPLIATLFGGFLVSWGWEIFVVRRVLGG